jgi:hypothetical protein
MTDRSNLGPTPGSGFAAAAVTGPFSGPPAAARALALAVGCPDLFVIDAAAGPDRDGFAAAVAATVARLGRTVLVVAPDGPTADALLSHLSADRDPPAARAVGPEESVETLPDAVRSRTTTALRERAEHQARSRRPNRHTSDLDEQRTTLRRRIADAQGQIAALVPLRVAQDSRRIWSGLFWKATFTGNVANRVTALEKQIAEWDAEIRGLDGACATAEAETPFDGIHRGPDCPIVVTPVATVGHDAATSGPFDHVVVASAERVPADALAAVRRCGARCVLIGARFGRSAGPHFADLYAAHDTGPWVAEGGRLVYRAIAVPTHRRNELKGEPLTDRPEIELRFLAVSGREVELAEVVFPESVSPAEARSWLAAELGISRLIPCGPHHWQDGPGPLRACWPLADTVPEPPRAWADLGDGVRELVAGTGADAVSAAVTFDPDRWDRPAAEAWLADALADTSPRAVRLPRVTGVQTVTPLPEPVGVG